MKENLTKFLFENNLFIVAKWVYYLVMVVLIVFMVVNLIYADVWRAVIYGLFACLCLYLANNLVIIQNKCERVMSYDRIEKD